MKKLILKLLLIFIIILLVSYCILNPYNNDEIKYSDNKNIYFGSEKVILSNMSDPLFADSEYSYNHNLAKESLRLAVSAYSANVSELNWGEDKSIGREDNVKSFLGGRGYGNMEFHNYDISLNDFSSKVAFSLSYKPYDRNTSIVAIVIRGGNYGLEWSDNFNLGNSETLYHRGFYEATLGVKLAADNYIKKYCSNKKIKLWITGYSRGGAVANILASMYNEGKSTFPCSIYAYTFASPKTTIVSQTKAHDTIHKNIFNILSPNDPIYNIPPQKWGFGRFGICVVFPDKNDLSYDGAEIVNRKVAKSYYSQTGEILVISGNSVNSLISIFVKSAKSRDFFSENLSVPVMDFIKIKMTKHKNENGLWQPHTNEEMLKILYGKDALKILETIRNNDMFVSFKKIGFNIPDDIYTFITLCHLNGFENYENTLFSEININDVNEISYIASGNSIATGHRSEFYSSWLENVNIQLLKFVKE